MHSVYEIKSILPDFKFVFEDETEKLFRKEYAIDSLPVLRASLILSIFLYGIFGILDVYMLPETAIIAWIIRFVFVIPFLIITIILTFTKFFLRFSQEILIITSLVAGFGIILMIDYSYPYEPGNKYYYSGLLLIVMVLYTYLRLRFWNSVLAGALILLGYEFTAIFDKDLSIAVTRDNLVIFLSNNFFFIGANVIGMWASYSTEKLNRSNFLRKQIILKESEERAQISESLRIQNNLIEEQKNSIAEKNKELEEVNASKDKFFSIIAHDLRNPFNTIIANSHPMLNNIHSSNRLNIEQRIAGIHEAAQNAFKLLENLLEWARSKTGRIYYQPMLLSISSLYDIAYNLTENMARNKNITLLFDANGIEVVYGDMNMIRTVLRNLVSNAVKFSHRGSVVNINTIQRGEDIVISVKDNGTGIATGNLDKLFNLNSKISTQGTENETGTGLGLLLCKEYVEKHGGRIWVTSKLGNGSEFCFSLPVLK
ncbi:MAG: HAMP domain-containing histidine kinase [Ignavibacteriales bacterium]|nr:HAMP domain-containing histidine kinase [Ignavibacteriales bacterium]MCF8315721.1 HAMP domain-containing histidine kinase [Ignavibacteriales bacterium]MCF8437085.1 HAMP domain-containing histidine kinase [Ignavibacteriales bacterium]